MGQVRPEVSEALHTDPHQIRDAQLLPFQDLKLAPLGMCPQLGVWRETDCLSPWEDHDHLGEAF